MKTKYCNISTNGRRDSKKINISVLQLYHLYSKTLVHNYFTFTVIATWTIEKKAMIYNTQLDGTRLETT